MKSDSRKLKQIMGSFGGNTDAGRSRNYKLNGNDPISNHRCKASSVKLIDRKTCKNSCKHFTYSKKSNKRVCKFGYT